VLHAIGMFDLASLTLEETLDCGDEAAWFSLGEVVMAGLLAAMIAVPAGFWFATRTGLPLAFIGAAVLFLPLFVFLPKLLRQAMHVETETVLIAFGRNEQVRKVFWTLFIATAGLVLAQIVDPEAARSILAALAGLVP
jgi:hypothetical protein